MFRSLPLCLLALALPAGAANRKPAAPTLVQKQGWASYEKDLQKKKEAVNKVCGTKLKSSYDRKSYPDFDPIKDRTQGACQAAVGTLVEVCRSEEGKDAVRKQVSRTTCRLSTKGTRVELKSGELLIHIDPVNSSIVGREPGSYSWMSAIKEAL